MSAAPIAPEHRRRYLLAGRATVTVVSAKTGRRFTFRLGAEDERTVVAWLMGPDNTSDFVEVGYIQRGDRFFAQPGDVRRRAALAFDWVWKHIESTQFELWHAGHCGRCGRLLTDPESIARGLGPKCAQMGAAA